jgi:hypothetical protein
LQKANTYRVGFLPGMQLEDHVAKPAVLIAVATGSHVRMGGDPASPGPEGGDAGVAATEPLGYVIAKDRYLRRDDLGVIYQLNVAPTRQRNLVGATLIKAAFERAAYGCRLFCCWCAQDLDANYFWEALGFVPLAFRTGCQRRRRTHIFWQRRVREGDCETPYWFPSQTHSGAYREDRLVLPIPPGTHWRDVMPIVLPGSGMGGSPMLLEQKEKHGRAARATNKKLPLIKPRTLGRLQFGLPAEPKAGKPKREKPQKVKNDPKLIAAARELRDRWLEHVNADSSALSSQGKYDVSRALSDMQATTSQVVHATSTLPALPLPLAA